MLKLPRGDLMKNKIICFFMSMVLIISTLSTVTSANEVKSVAEGFFSVKLQAGQTVQVSNPTFLDVEIKSEYTARSGIMRLEEVMYTNGNRAYSDLYCAPSYVIRKNERSEFQLTSGSVTLIITNELKNYVQVYNRNIFFKTILSKNQSIIIDNKSLGEAYMQMTNDGSNQQYEVVEYKDNKIKSVGIKEGPFLYPAGSTVTKLAIKSGSTVNSIEISLPYRLKDSIKVINQPTLKTITINPNESVEALSENDSTDKKMMFALLAVEGNKNEIQKYDSIEFDESSVYISPDNRTNSSSFQGKVRVTNKYQKPMTFAYDYSSSSNIRKTSAPALSKYTVQSSKSLVFTAINNLSAIYIDNTNKAAIDYVRNTSTSESILLGTILYGGNYSMSLNSKFQLGSESNKTFDVYVPYENRDNVKIKDNPVFYRYVDNNAKGLKIKNKTNEKINLYTEKYVSDRYNFVTYNSAYGRYDAKYTNNNAINVNGVERIYGNLKAGNIPQYYLAVPYDNKDKVDVYKIEDINEDKKVDILDLSSLINKYNTKNKDKSYDLNGDGIIDIYDVVTVASCI